jgi:hypothetical protein
MFVQYITTIKYYLYRMDINFHAMYCKTKSFSICNILLAFYCVKYFMLPSQISRLKHWMHSIVRLAKYLDD